MAFVPPPTVFRDRAKSEVFSQRRFSQQCKLRYTHCSSNTWTNTSTHHSAITSDQCAAEIAQKFDLQNRGNAFTQEELLGRYSCESNVTSHFDTPGQLGIVKATGTKVTVRRILNTNTQEAVDARREITILSTVADGSLPFLADWLELDDVRWTVIEYKSCRPLSEVIHAQGPMPESRLKTSLNQLFSATASLFAAGLAHLRISEETVYLDDEDQILIKDLQFVCTYGNERTNDLYAPTDEKYGSDIYVAPEVFANRSYNARKAVIWSLGVLIYFMTTGRTNTLSNLNHPSFESLTPDMSATPSQPPASHRRRISVATVQSKMIIYPSRFSVPNYARMIIPKMLTEEPMRRAELIEVASRIPKDYEAKATRMLMEVAWLDYKNHVGPNADLHVPMENESSASSIYSAVSNLSNPFASLLGKVGGSRRQSVPVGRYSGSRR